MERHDLAILVANVEELLRLARTLVLCAPGPTAVNHADQSEKITHPRVALHQPRGASGPLLPGQLPLGKMPSLLRAVLSARGTVALALCPPCAPDSRAVDARGRPVGVCAPPRSCRPWGDPRPSVLAASEIDQRFDTLSPRYTCDRCGRGLITRPGLGGCACPAMASAVASNRPGLHWSGDLSGRWHCFGCLVAARMEAAETAGIPVDLGAATASIAAPLARGGGLPFTEAYGS